jgi:hypothetical protein
MPATEAQWFWFAFFVGGAAGGWLLLVLAIMDFWRSFK